MTRLVNDPVNFPVELVDGFVKANSKLKSKISKPQLKTENL